MASGGAVLAALWGALAAALLLGRAGGVGADATCAPDQRTGLSLSRTNRTGHPHLNVRIEQPAAKSFWEINLTMWSSKCADLQKPTHTVLELSMSVAGDVLFLTPPPGYTELPGFGFYKRPLTPMAWEAARAHCEADGALLALPRTKGEMDALLHKFQCDISNSDDDNGEWVGASDIAEEGNWKSVTDEPLSKATSIATDGLDDGTSFNCLAFRKDHRIFTDIGCSKIFGFFCEWKRKL